MSSSKNTAMVLDVTGTTDLFEVRVDGVVAAEVGLPGKPDPAMYLETARRLRSRRRAPSWSRTRSPASRPAAAAGSAS